MMMLGFHFWKFLWTHHLMFVKSAMFVACTRKHVKESLKVRLLNKQYQLYTPFKIQTEWRVRVKCYSKEKRSSNSANLTYELVLCHNIPIFPNKHICAFACRENPREYCRGYEIGFNIDFWVKFRFHWNRFSLRSSSPSWWNDENEYYLDWRLHPTACQLACWSCKDKHYFTRSVMLTCIFVLY